jgi:hypothetical protein
MTTRTAPSKADLKAAAELDAMADAIDPGLTDEQISALGDLEFGRAVAKQGAARQLRKRAAELRQDPEARWM